MNIYYFNITYTCNSNCVFCYSHNTIHNGMKHNEISLECFVDYLKTKNIQKSDRVIINGGEPFLHSKIIELLKVLIAFECEVLIYTNGRCLSNYDFSFLTENFRFVIPVHGYKALHDSITRCGGSFDSMYQGLNHLSSFCCKVDIKVILNPQMISSRDVFDKTLDEIDTLSFNNAIHITKMADTVISKKNGIPSILNDQVSIYTNLLFEHCSKKGKVIKIFDTCVKDIDVGVYEDRSIPIKVHFKDAQTEWDFNLYTPSLVCREECPKKRFCQSAVGNYTVLEYNSYFYKGIE